MFSFSLPPAFPEPDFETLADEEKSYYLSRLQAAYPNQSCFEAGQYYSIRDEKNNPLTLRMAKLLVKASLSNARYAWYVESARSALVDGKHYVDCYAVTRNLVQVIPETAPADYRKQINIQIVDVDFQRLNLPGARYFASILPRLAQSYPFSHYKKGINRLMLSEDLRLDLTLSHDLIPRKSSKHPDQDRFAVVGELLGKGGYALVYDNPTTLHIKDDGVFHEKQKPRIARFSFLRDPNNQKSRGTLASAIESEDKLMQALSDRKAKPSFFKNAQDQPGERVAIRFEKRIPGVELKRIIKGEMGDLKSWTTEQRLRVAIAFLRAVHEQVHENGLIHCDIKPENVMVADWDTESPKVHVIDFNLSRLKSDRTIPNKIVGTPLYLAPERLTKTAIPDEASDAFAAGITAATLFGHDSQVAKSMIMLERYLKHYEFIDLFEYGSAIEFDEAEVLAKNNIEAVLMGLVHPNSSDRFGLLDAATQLESILSELHAQRQSSQKIHRGVM